MIDLNADLGEGFPNDEAILALITSASVCCGAHAGGRETIIPTLRAARDRGVVVGEFARDVVSHDRADRIMGRT